jgi:phosphoribosylglycinamide formyltransferase-1
MGGRSHLRSVKRIAILASGSGSNAQCLVEHFRGHAAAEVVLIGCDQPNAGVLQRAWDLGMPSYLFNGAQLRDGTVLHELQGLRVDLIVLAGFLRLIPAAMVQAFPGRIVNIHPALLPKYGGKGMYGQRVHESVIASGERESGITIHLVNEHYDEGEHLFQARCPVLPEDTSETLAQRIHTLEHGHLPRVVEELIGTLAMGQ